MRPTLLFALALACAACATTGPVSGTVVAGAAALVAVFDQLLAAGTLTGEQHQALVAGLTELQRTVDVAASRPTLGAEEAAGIAGGTTATVLALLRAWQSFQRRRTPAPPPAS